MLNLSFSQKITPAPAPSSPQTAENPDQILDWLNVNDFAEIIAANEPQFEKVENGSWKSATKPGDNFASQLLKIDIQAKLKGKIV